MARERIALAVFIDLDPMPGTMNTEESARTIVRNILNQRMSHYNPVVFLASTTKKPNTEEKELRA